MGLPPRAKREEADRDSSMENENQSPRTFIVRLWRERSEDRAFIWRGSVDCVQSGERAYFQNIEGLKEVIARLAGSTWPENGEHPEERDSG